MKPPSLKLYCIEQKQNKDNSRIILSISWDGRRVIFYPGLSCKSYQWDYENGKFKNIENRDALNDALSSLKKQITDLHRSLAIRYGIVTIPHLKLELSRLKVKPGYTLERAFLIFIEKNEKRWSKNTFLRCQSFYSKLNRFVELYDPSCSIERVDKEFIEAFNKYLKREGLNLNSRYSFVNLLKWFLSWALKEGMLINDDFRKFSLKSLSKGEMDEPPPLYLVWEELVKIYNSDPGSRRLEHCRDIYCFMAFTGCKLDELQKLGKSDIEKDYIIINGKNSRRIAMNSFSKKITEQYMNKYYRRGDLFPYYTKMTLNKYIRELCVFLNFEREVKIRRGGKVLISAISKLITINSAKPTFYANAVKMGLSPGLIQLWTGNESLSSYKRIKKDIRKQENENITIINKYYEDTL